MLLFHKLRKKHEGPGAGIHFFEMFSKFKYFGNILNMLHEEYYTHRIGELEKIRGKIRPTIVKFVRYNDRNRVFRNKKLKGQKIPITESLTKIRKDELRQAKETYGFTNVWTNDGKILFKSDSNAKPQVYYS